MGFLLTLLLILIFFGCLGFLYMEGMWGNMLNLINVVTAALLATSYFEPVARLGESMLPGFTYYWDFLSIWLLFAVIVTILRQITRTASQVKVRFMKVVDRVGSGFFAAWIGWVMICFTMFSLHTAPLGRNFLFGGFQPEQKMFLGLAPDRQWLAFVQKMSAGAYSRDNVFDPECVFPIKYATRRANLQDHVESTGTTRVN